MTVSYRSGLRCCNDHMFVCPRELCSPYASLLDNFRDARCRAPPGYSSGGDGVKLDGTLREAPDLTWTSWYLSRAYNGHRSTDTLRHERCALSSPGYVKSVRLGPVRPDARARLALLDCPRRLKAPSHHLLLPPSDLTGFANRLLLSGLSHLPVHPFAWLEPGRSRAVRAGQRERACMRSGAVRRREQM